MSNGLDVLVHHKVHIDDNTLERLFEHFLESLTEEWYIALSEKNSSRWVLCKESSPHPRNGDTYREFERDLKDPQMELIRHACELQEVWKRKKEGNKRENN